MNNYELTEQQIFDKVVNHLRKQRTQAMEGDGCVYRARNGNMCAVGCLIADEDYNPNFERNDVLSLNLDIYYNRIAASGQLTEFLKNNETLLSRLQAVHDENKGWDVDGLSEEGEEELRNIAKNFGLEYTAP